MHGIGGRSARLRVTAIESRNEFDMQNDDEGSLPFEEGQEEQEDKEEKEEDKEGSLSRDILSNAGLHEAPSVDNKFSKLGLSSDLLRAMDAKELIEPTPVQKSVIPRLNAGENLVMAASTGSGKTLAYLLPAIQSMATQEAKGYVRSAMRPRCLVLVPTRELARQVLIEVKSVAHYCKVSARAVLGGEEKGQQRKELSGITDVVVASPGRLLDHWKQGNVYFSQVTHVIIDEVDTMLIQGFGNEVREMLRATLGRKPKDYRSSRCQLIMATATLTAAVRSLLDDVQGFDFLPEPEDATKDVRVAARVKVNIAEVDGVHRALPNIRHDSINVFDQKGVDKLELLLQLLQKSVRSNHKCMVFCNTLASARAVDHKLAEDGVECLSYHSGLNSLAREANMKLFREPKGAGCDLLICTDIAARGIDIPEIDHVVMFDFPLNPIDYIHRAGRTGRAGKKGRVTALVNRRDQVLNDAIQGAIARRLPLDTLTSDKEDYTRHGKLASVLGREQKKKVVPRSRSSSSSGGKSRSRSSRGGNFKPIKVDKETLQSKKGSGPFMNYGRKRAPAEGVKQR